MGVAAGDRWVWAAFVLACLVSGGVAWLGDLIGRRIGRRRLTLFGLRPRNTAILFTVLTGMLIAGLTIASLLLASEGARQRILHYSSTVETLISRAQEQQRLRQDAERLAKLAAEQKAAAEQHLVTAERELRRAEADQRAAQQRAAAAAEQARATQAKVEAARRSLLEAQRRRNEADQRSREAQQRAQEAQQRAQEAQQRAQEAQQRAQEAQQRYQEAQRRYQEAEAKVAQATAAQRQLDERLKAAQAKLDAVAKDLEAAAKELASAQAVFSRTYANNRFYLEQIEQQIAKAAAELERLRNEREQLRAELQQARVASAQLRAEATQALTGEVVVGYGGELARSRFNSYQPRERVVDQMDTFLRASNARARDLGAGTDERYGSQYAVLLGIDAQGNAYAGEDFRLNLVRVLSDLNRPVWLRAIALRNTVRGRPVFYSVRLDPDRLVFGDGEVIASAAMDGREDEVAIARRLETLVKEQVNPLAQRRGLLPRPDERLAIVGPDKWLPAMRRIRDAGQVVTVDVVAVGEIRAGDRLEVEFRVRGNGSP